MVSTVLVPPLNFALVGPGVYRSGYPNRKNFEFLKKLQIKSILYLCEDDYSQDNLDFFKDTGIQVFHVKLEGSKEPFKELSSDLMTDALVQVLDKRNHPILVHCNKGKHRAGCLVACIRKMECWSLAATLEEYRRFTGSFGSKIRMDDQEFIQVFDHTAVPIDREHAPDWLEEFCSSKMLRETIN